MQWIAAGVASAVLAGSLVYCMLVAIAACKYLRQPVGGAARVPVSVLKPLHGLDEGLEENLRSFFEQDYEDFEILFATRSEADPAFAVAGRLAHAYPHIASRVILTGEPPWPNAKAWSLECMQSQAKHELLLMSDSDIRARPDLLRTIAGEFNDPALGVSSCPYRAVGGPSLWSMLEALGMNTEFLGGVLAARMLEGVKFALGPTLAARKSAVAAAGGWAELQTYLAEDFVLGNRAAERGFGVILSRAIVEHRIGSEGFQINAAHRLRWARSTRRSRPAGYVGQVFTNPLPIALVLIAVLPAAWPVIFPAAALRAIAGYATAELVLSDSAARSRWYMIPLQDLVSFAFWIAGFFGDTIIWRGSRYRLLPDGRFESADAETLAVR